MLKMRHVVFGLAAILTLAAGSPAQEQTTATAPPLWPQGQPLGSWHVTDYPAAQVAAVPPAMAAAAVARTQLGLSRLELNARIAHLRRDFEQSEDYQAALRSEEEAWRDLQAARLMAVRSVRSSAAYRLTEQRRDLVDAQLNDLRNDASVSPHHLVSLAHEKLRYARTLSAMESAAMDNDDAIRAARERLSLAGERLRDLRRQFDQQVRGDEQLIATRQAIRDHRVAAVGAEVFLRGVVLARNIGMDYAYHLHRYRPQPVYVPVYGAYGSYPSAWYGTPRWE